MRERRELTFSEGPGQAFFTCYLIYYPHLKPSLATGILWVGPFGRRFPPVLPADFTEHHWYEGSGLAVKEVLFGGWGLGGGESWESGRGSSQQGGRSWRKHRREETANQPPASQLCL